MSSSPARSGRALTGRRLGAHAAEALALLLIGAMFAVVLTPAIDRLTWMVVALPVGLVVCWWLLWRPAVTLAVIFAATVLFEDSGVGFPFGAGRFWGNLAGPIHPPDVLLLVLLAGVVIEWADAHEPPTAGRFTMPLLTLVLCAAGGLVTGYLGGGNFEDIYNSVRVLVMLITIPFAATQLLLDDRRRQAAAIFAAALVAGRAAVALLGVLVSAPPPTAAFDPTAGFGEASSTFYEPTMNFLMVVFLLFAVGSLLARYRLPRWALAASPLVAVAIVLSFRRSFWISAVLGVTLVIIAATGRRGRPWLVFGAAALALALWLSFSAGGSTDTTNPVLARAESISPSQIQSTSGDRYRFDEQRNVVADIRAHPLTGLGLGVPWTARYPLAEEHVGGRFYTHVTPLWYWLKLGPLGFLTYVWLQATAVLVGYRVWRRARDPLERVAGLALSFGFVGLVTADLTGAFTGVNLRLTIVVGCLLGWLAAAELASRKPAEPVVGATPALAV